MKTYARHIITLILIASTCVAAAPPSQTTEDQIWSVVNWCGKLVDVRENTDSFRFIFNYYEPITPKKDLLDSCKESEDYYKNNDIEYFEYSMPHKSMFTDIYKKAWKGGSFCITSVASQIVAFSEYKGKKIPVVQNHYTTVHIQCNETASNKSSNLTHKSAVSLRYTLLLRSS